MRHSTLSRSLSRSLLPSYAGTYLTNRLNPSQGPGYTRAVSIVTLDPNKFVEKKQKRLWLGNKTVYYFNVQLPTAHHLTSKTTLRFDYDRRGPPGTLWHSPPDLKAFLYYTTPPGRPRIGGELRLRVTSSDDPASFASGSDLLRTSGQPWSRPLYNVSRSFIPLYQKLREDRLVSDELDSSLSTLPVKRLVYSLNQLLYTINDPFTVDFGPNARNLTVITERGMATIQLRKQFFDGRVCCRGFPYTGTAMARFERSTLPDHKGTRTMVLRFLKIITPVKCVVPLYDGYVGIPKEGELYIRHPRSNYSPLGVWNADIDLDKSQGLVVQGLRLLWDT